MREDRQWLANIRGKLTHEEVAKIAGISRSTYSNIESGNRNPSVKVAKKIAHALKFDWSLFFDQKRFDTKQNRQIKNKSSA